MVPTTEVTLSTGVVFNYGSLIGLNGTAEKLADGVRIEEANAAQKTMLMGLNRLFEGRPANGIGKVENSSLPDSRLFVASRNVNSAPGLVFAVLKAPEQQDQAPAVLRVGISSAERRPSLLKALGFPQTYGKRRKV